MITQSPAEVLAAWFVFNNLATRPASSSTWPLTTSAMPEDLPDNRISLYNASTLTDGQLSNSGETLVRPEVQIRVRSKPASIGYIKLVELLNAILPLKAESILTNENVRITIVAVALVSGPTHIGQEEKNQRQHHTANVRVVLVPGV